MKNYRELANDIFARRDRYVAAQKKKRQRLLLMTASLGSCVLVALMGFEMVNSSWFRHEPAVTDRVVHPSSATSTTETTTTTEATSTDGTTASTPSEGTSHSTTQGSILVVPQTTTQPVTEAPTTHSTQQSVVTHVTESTSAPTTTGQTTQAPSTAPSSTTQTPSVTATGTITTKTTAITKATTTTRTTVTTQTTTQTNPSVTRPTTRRPTTQTTASATATTTTEPSQTNPIKPTTSQTKPTTTQTQPTTTQTTVTTRPTTTQPSNEDPVDPLPEWPYLWIIYDMNANYANGEVPIYFKLEGFEEVPFDWVKETSYTADGFSVLGDIAVERDAETGAIIYRMVLAYDGVTPKPSFFFSVVTADGMKQTDGLYGYQADHGFFVCPSYDSAFSSSVYYLVKTGVITFDEYQAIMEKYWSESVNGPVHFRCL